MVKRRRSLKHTRRLHKKSLRQKKTYRKKSIHINKKNSNKITRKLGRLHHVGGAEEDDPISHDDIELAKDFIETNGLAPEGESSQDFVESIVEKLQEEVEKEQSEGFAVVTRPTKLSLYGKLFEYIFARKDLGLNDTAYKEFTNTKNQEKFDVDVKFTRGSLVPEVYRGCFLSLKTKKVTSDRSPPFSGYVETGKAKTLLESLQFVVSGKIGESGFKMVVESYCPLEFDGKLAAIEGVHRRVYDIKGEIGTILGKYNSLGGIEYLLENVSTFNQRGSEILNNPNLTLEERCSLLNRLKDEINAFSNEMLRNRCLVRLDVKESSECRTFIHVVSKGKGKAKPQYRVASSLNLKGFEIPRTAAPSSPLVLRSPSVSPTASRRTPIQADWIRGVSLFPNERLIRDPDESSIEEFLKKFYSSARGAVASSAKPSARGAVVVASSAKPSAKPSARGAVALSATPFETGALVVAPSLKPSLKPSRRGIKPESMLSPSPAQSLAPAPIKRQRTPSSQQQSFSLYPPTKKSTSSTRGLPQWVIDSMKREEQERKKMNKYA